MTQASAYRYSLHRFRACISTATTRPIWATCGSVEDMVEGFGHLMRRQLPKMIPGRSCLIHIAQGVARKLYDNYIGIRDFRGPIVKMMTDAGWIHYGEIAIDKNPQIKAVRTKDMGLLFATLRRDAANMHVAAADMLLHFRAPGDNPEPVRPEVTEAEWIRWAGLYGRLSTRSMMESGRQTR